MNRMTRKIRMVLAGMMIGSSPFALDGCDVGVRDTILNGVGSAATSLSSTFIQAFIESLQNDDEGDATTI